MKRWVGVGVVVAILYAFVAASVYQRKAWKYRQDVIAAGYRLDDAEEARREVAQKIQVTTGKPNTYVNDPEYIAAEAKTAAAREGFPKESGLADLKSNEVLIGVWGAGIYIVALIGLAIRGRLAR